MFTFVSSGRDDYDILRNTGLHRPRGELSVPRALSRAWSAPLTPPSPADPAGAGVRPLGGLVGAGRAAVRDAGGAASLRGGQRGRPVREHPARRRAVPRVAVQGRRLHTQGY